MKNLTYSLFAGVVIAALAAGGTVSAAAYDPEIDPADFSSDIDNKYFTLEEGMELEYEGEMEDGTEKIKIEVTGETKKIMGVTTLVQRDRVWLDGELIEDTRDYLAQHKDGTVWYFGEDVDNYEDGKLKDHDGAWLAGEDGAKPGIWMEGDPEVGDEYRQEYLPGEAEDMAEVLSLKAKVSVPYGTFSNCLKTKDWTPLEPDVVEYKYYCPSVKTLVLEENLEDEERIELVDVETSDDDGDEDNDEDDDEDEEDDDDSDMDDGDHEDTDNAAEDPQRIAMLQQLESLLKQLIVLLQLSLAQRQ